MLAGLNKPFERSIAVFTLFSLMITVLVVATPTFAEDKTAEIDKIFSWATSDSPGCTCAVSLNGELVVNRAYGSADLERELPITPSTVFDAGSLQKQFVAAAALILVEDKKISLSEDIRKYLPDLPEYGHKITIDHLLTHTSGVRDWTGLLMLAPGKPDVLSLILRQRGLNFAPGEEFSYSNSGVVLAKEIVARMSSMSFAEFTRKRMFEPLKMKSTQYREDIRGIENGALAYEKEDGSWTTAMMLGNQRGGGGVFSTSEDLILWNEGMANNRLGAFVSEKLHEPTTLNNGRKLDYTRGLFLKTHRGAKLIWHTGSAEGYKSFLGRFPEHGLSIAIMCNSGDDTDREEFAARIFDLFVPAAGDQPFAEGDGPPPPAPEGMDMASKAGLFINDRTGQLLRLAVDRGRFRIADGPGLVPVTDDHFRRWGASLQFMSGDEFELRFQSADQFDLKSMDGKTTRYRRAEPYAPASNNLKAFVGRYKCDDLGTVIGIEPGDDGLAMSLEHMPGRRLEFKPATLDTFQFSRMTIRFNRDKAGKVNAFELSNPMLRNLKFKRQPRQSP